MSRKTTTHKKSRRYVRAIAAVAVVLGAGLISAAPARADHHGGVGFHFFFGLPFPPIPVPVPVYEPPVYYGPPVYYEAPPVYYAPRAYYGRPYGYWYGPYREHDYWRGHEARYYRGHGRRGHGRHHD